MKVAFRVESGKKIGMGHVKRCLVIAKHLSKKGINIFFLISNSSIKEIINSHGYKTFQIKKSNEGSEIKRILTKENCNKLIIDSKRKSVSDIFNHLRSKTKIIMIDNLNNAKYVDLVIIPSIKDSSKRYPKNTLVGIEYVLPGIYHNPKLRRKRDGTILISAGSTDKYNITYRLVSEFAKMHYDFKILVVLGKFFENENKIIKLISNDNRFRIVKDLPDLTEHMTKCSLGIVTFGITVYEGAVCGLPLFVISHSEENEISAENVERYNWIRYLGKYDVIHYPQLVKKIIATLNDKFLLKEMVQAGKCVDGMGPLRVANAIISL